MQTAVGETTFARSLQIQLNVLGALLMREIITRYGRHNFGVFWLFLEPMIFTLGVLGLWIAANIGHGRNLPIVAFCVTGYSSVLLWRNCANRCSMAILPNLGLLYHRNVRAIDLFVSRILLEVAGATASFIVLTCFFVSIGLMDWPVDLVGVLFGWFMLAWFGGSLAILIGASTAFNDVVERIWHPATYILFGVSGAVFMVDWLPTSYHKYVLLLPMVNGVEILREGYFGHLVRAHYDLPYLISFCLIQTLFGLILVRKAGRSVGL